jgi:hypothetical protein
MLWPQGNNPLFSAAPIDHQSRFACFARRGSQMIID